MAVRSNSEIVNPDRFQVLVLNSNDNSVRYSYKIKKISFEEYGWDKEQFLNNRAKLTLTEELTFEPEVNNEKPVVSSIDVIIPKHINLFWKTAVLTSWKGEQWSQYKMRFINKFECQRRLSYFSLRPIDTQNDEEFCAVFSTILKPKACDIDNGSLLQIQEGQVWYLVGIASWSVTCFNGDWPVLYREVYTTSIVYTIDRIMVKDSLLFTPIKFGNVLLKNRICISPMCQYSCESDGKATDWHLVHLGARAIGGAGVVMMEATAVEPRGRISNHCPGIWSEEHLEPLKRITSFIKKQNCIAAIQLAHSGRKGSRYPPWLGRKPIPLDQGGWEVLGPSPIAFDDGYNIAPQQASLQDIIDLKQAFVNATKRSLEAGFQLIELHFAHGYLINQFLSPLSNERNDEYGGSFENRIRLGLEIVELVKSTVPDGFPIFVRISCTEYAEEFESEGWNLDESIEFCKRLKDLGVDLVDCSSGGNLPASKSFVYNNVDQITLAEEIQRRANIATGAVGLIVNPLWAEQLLKQGKASLVLIGRASLDDPNWPLHAAFQLGANNQFDLPIPYSYSIGSSLPNSWRNRILFSSNHQQLTNCTEFPQKD